MVLRPLRATAPPLALVLALALALALAPFTAGAQLIEAPAADRHGDVPAAPGRGAQTQFVRSIFGGFPPSLADAQMLIAGTSVAPAFDLWCGLIPYVDFSNGTYADSAGRQAPDVLCLPFLDPARMNPPDTCRALPGVPTGRYYMNGGAAMRVRALLAVRDAGTYTFAWGHDDGMGMYLGEVTVFEYLTGTAARVDRRAVHFAAPGLYGFQLDWFDEGGGALIDWYVAPGDLTAGTFDPHAFHLVPATDLYPAELLPCTPHCTPCPSDAPRCDYDLSRCVQCITDMDCPSCQVCDQGTCRAASWVPGADAGPGCAPDAGAPDGGAVRLDGDTGSDGPGSGPVPPTGGCACGVMARQTGSRVGAWAGLLLVMTSRLRRRRRSPGRAFAGGEHRG